MSEFQDLDREYRELTGEDMFLYATQPIPGGVTKYVFQDRIITNRGNALEYLRLKVAAAREAQEAARAANGPTTKEAARQPSGGNSGTP